VTKGSLRSQPIDEALFTLPVGAMSRILQDDEGCHIIRVVERDEIKRASFAEVQPEIKKALQSGGEAERKKEYIESLREKTPVWSVFDESPEAQAGALVR
jgi:parvulin-like peptidyl-prolyl isomerase